MVGGPIDVEPNVLVVSAELETVGEQLIAEIKPIQVSDVDPFSKLVKMVVEPRLPPTDWYFVAEPSMVDGLEYAYLVRSPGRSWKAALASKSTACRSVSVWTSVAPSSPGEAAYSDDGA